MSKQELAKRNESAVDLLGDINDPRSLKNTLPPPIVEASYILLDEHFNMSDAEILKELPKTFAVRINRLRESMWLHIHNNSRNASKIPLKSVYYGICSAYQFNNYLTDPLKVAYILRPPINYKLAMQEALTFSVEQIRDILEQDHMNERTGMLDPKIADVKRRIWEGLADRVKGMPVQRTENLNVNKEIGPNQDFHQPLPSNPDDIDKKIQELENDMNPRDVTQDE